MSPKVRLLILKLAGALLIFLGILHLGVTPLIAGFIEQYANTADLDFFKPPMLLNHVVVGILLLPLGFFTYYAASPSVGGEKWAIIFVRTTAMTVVVLPAVLFVLLGDRYFSAAPFLIATTIVSIAAAILLVAAFWPGKRSAV